MTDTLVRFEGKRLPDRITRSVAHDSSLMTQFIKFTLGEFPTDLNNVDWQMVSDEVSPRVRKILGPMEMEPPHKI